MKKALAIFCLISVFTACSYKNNNNNSMAETSNPTTTPTTAENLNAIQTINNIKFPFIIEENAKTKIPQVKNKLSNEEISKLNRKKCGYGQGVRMDQNNRPYGALDFNSEFEKYDSYAISTEEKVIYLTFDQGYENGFTTKILDVLKEKNVKATFFIIGDYEERNSELVRKI